MHAEFIGEMSFNANKVSDYLLYDLLEEILNQDFYGL